MTATTATTSWRILTSGPCPKFTGTSDEVRAQVERNAPLKRGWTGEWVELVTIPDVAAYVRRNSKGAIVRGYTVTVQPA